MKNKNIFIVILSIFIIMTSFVSCKKKEEKIKVGVLQLIQHPALDEANNGFVKALKDRGYIDGKNIEIDQKNAQGKIDIANQIAGQFVTDNKDLIFTIATPSTQAACNQTDEIPIVYTAVTDPVTDGLVKSMKNSGNNVTGTSDAVSIEEQLKLLKELIPDAKTVGIIYTTSETNSVNQVNELNKLSKKFDLKVKEIGVANINEINQNLTNGLDGIDVLYAPTDNNVAASYELVAKICLEKKVPMMAAEPAAIKSGGLICKGIDYFELGKMAGDKAADILEGKLPEDIESEMMKELKITINKDVANKLEIKIPEKIIKDAEVVTGGVD